MTHPRHGALWTRHRGRMHVHCCHSTAVASGTPSADGPLQQRLPRVEYFQRTFRQRNHLNQTSSGYCYRICRNKHPGRLIFRSNKKNIPKSIKTNRFCVLPPLKNHPSKLVGFVYSPLWKIIHQKPSVLCTPPFEKSSIKTNRFCVLPPLKNHPSKLVGFVYSPPLDSSTSNTEI